MSAQNDGKAKNYEEKELSAANGGAMLVLTVFLYLASCAGTIVGFAISVETAAGIPIGIVSLIYFIFGWIFFLGFKTVKPNEALVMTFFGKYSGTLKKEGFFFVNPFCTAINPTSLSLTQQPALNAVLTDTNVKSGTVSGTIGTNSEPYSKKISLKAITLVNKKQKINDEMGNPIEVGIVVIWRVVNTAKAVFNVDNYKEYISTQADSALRDVVRKYPYDISGNGDEASLRGSSQLVADDLKNELQNRVSIAGLEVIEARITHLAYAPEIAAAMLQRQQASAIIEAKQKIVDGAVGMVEMALNKLSENKICELDEERKAAMVSNLLVVLCANKEAQPVVNSGSLY